MYVMWRLLIFSKQNLCMDHPIFSERLNECNRKNIAVVKLTGKRLGRNRFLFSIIVIIQCL